MAGKKKAVEAPTRHQVDTSKIQIGSGNAIPRMLKESKYPWAALLEGAPGELDFTIPMSQDDAEKLRVSVQTSGRSYYSARGIARRAVVRVVDEGLRAWALEG